MTPLTASSLLIPLLAGLLAWAIARWMVRHAARLNVVVEPNHRSSHIRPTPGSGGIGIVAGSLIAGVLLFQGLGNFGVVVMALSLLIAAIGLRDDIRYLSIKTRLFVQLLCMGGLLTVLRPYLPDELVTYSPILLIIPITAGIWWLNLFNFMDGIDGMAAMQVIFMLLAAIALGSWQHSEIIGSNTWLWILSLAAATIGFLSLNWSPARIFMGDVGSLYLGFMIFAVALWSILQGWMTLPAWLILAAVFVTDATTTLATRILRGERWYEAHCSHVYQRLARHWRSHARTTRFYLFINFGWLLPLAAITAYMPSPWMAVALAYFPLLAGALLVGAGRPGNIQETTPAPTPSKTPQPERFPS